MTHVSSIDTLVQELRGKGYSSHNRVSEKTLRADYKLPEWVAVTPAFVQLLNEQLGVITVGDEIPPPPPSQNGRDEKERDDSAGPDIFDLFIGALGGYTKK